MPCDLTVCMLDIFCSGPSILHMPSSFLQASSSLSSHQPGTVCRNIQTCCEIARQLDPSRLWKWELNKRSRTKPPDLSISHPRKRKNTAIWLQDFWRHAPCTAGFELMDFLSQVSSDCWRLGSLGRCPSILHAAICYRRMASGWFLLIFCSPRLAKSSLPFQGSASVKGTENILDNTSIHFLNDQSCHQE